MGQHDERGAACDESIGNRQLILIKYFAQVLEARFFPLYSRWNCVEHAWSPIHG